MNNNEIFPSRLTTRLSISPSSSRGRSRGSFLLRNLCLTEALLVVISLINNSWGRWCWYSRGIGRRILDLIHGSPLLKSTLVRVFLISYVVIAHGARTSLGCQLQVDLTPRLSKATILCLLIILLGLISLLDLRRTNYVLRKWRGRWENGPWNRSRLRRWRWLVLPLLRFCSWLYRPNILFPRQGSWSRERWRGRPSGWCDILMCSRL